MRAGLGLVLKFLTVSWGNLTTHIILEQQDMPLETARHQGRKCTGHERSRGWYLVSVQLVTLTSLTSFYLFSGKLEYLNKKIRFNTSIVRMKMNPCEEIRRRQMPQTFQEEMKWFAKGFHQPETRRNIFSNCFSNYRCISSYDLGY